MPQKPVVYPVGYHGSMLRAQMWRTVANSAAFLLSSLLAHMKILDIGCGPGTITADLATLVPDGHVVGLDKAPGMLDIARETAEHRGVKNIEFVTGDVRSLDYPDGTFDVVYTHQVLQHIADPVQALREMGRVAKPGGIVAVREMDFSTTVWYPDLDALSTVKPLYLQVARVFGGELDAGRRLHVWAREAGFDPARITCTSSTWCIRTPEDRKWFSEMCADVDGNTAFSQSLLSRGLATQEDLVRIAQGWREWAMHADGWLSMTHGEILCHV